MIVVGIFIATTIVATTTAATFFFCFRLPFFLVSVCLWVLCVFELLSVYVNTHVFIYPHIIVCVCVSVFGRGGRGGGLKMGLLQDFHSPDPNAEPQIQITGMQTSEIS